MEALRRNSFIQGELLHLNIEFIIIMRPLDANVACELRSARSLPVRVMAHRVQFPARAEIINFRDIQIPAIKSNFSLDNEIRILPRAMQHRQTYSRFPFSSISSKITGASPRISLQKSASTRCCGRKFSIGFSAFFSNFAGPVIN